MTPNSGLVAQSKLVADHAIKASSMARAQPRAVQPAARKPLAGFDQEQRAADQRHDQSLHEQGIGPIRVDNQRNEQGQR